MLNKLIKIVSDQAGEPALPDDTFDELGLDSLDLAEIVMTIESDLFITISDEDLENSCPKTAKDLSAMALEAVSDIHGAKAA